MEEQLQKKRKQVYQNLAKSTKSFVFNASPNGKCPSCDEILINGELLFPLNTCVSCHYDFCDQYWRKELSKNY